MFCFKYRSASVWAFRLCIQRNFNTDKLESAKQVREQAICGQILLAIGSSLAANMVTISADISAHAGFLRHCLGLGDDRPWDASAAVGVFADAAGSSYKTIFPKTGSTPRAGIGAFLAHMSQAIRSLELSKSFPKEYARAYGVVRQTPALAMCGLFSTLQVVTATVEESAAATVVEGSAIATVERSAMILEHAPIDGFAVLLVCLSGRASLQGAKGSSVSSPFSVLANSALVFFGAPGQILQAHAEQGSPCIVVLMSACPTVLSSAAKKQLAQWSRAASKIDEARKQHQGLFKARKPCQCIDVSCPVAEAAGESSAAGGQSAAGSACQMSAPQGEEGGATRVASWNSSSFAPCKYLRLSRAVAPALEAAGFDVLYPWVRGPMVHRFIHLTPASEAVLRLYQAAVRSFAPGFTQAAWCFQVDHGRRLVGDMTHAHVLDANILMSHIEWSSLLNGGFPIALIKDMIMFNALRVFGGWWADLDAVWAGSQGPDSVVRIAEMDHDVVLFTEYERACGAYVKEPRHLMWPKGATPAAVNLGLAYSVAGAAFWQECLLKCRQHWASTRDIDWANYRTNKHASAHQLIVQNLARVSSSVTIEKPPVGYAIPRWASAWSGESCSRTFYGVRVPSKAEIHQHAFSINCWSGFWDHTASWGILEWVLSRRREWKGESVARAAESANNSAAQVAETSNNSAGALATRFFEDLGKLLTDGCAELMRLGVCVSVAHRMTACALDFATRATVEQMLAHRSSREHALNASAAVFMQAGVKMEWLKPRCSSEAAGVGPSMDHVPHGMHTFYAVEPIGTSSSSGTATILDHEFFQTLVP